jgi:site-specific recombinase XerD
MSRTNQHPESPIIRSFATAKRLGWSPENVYNAVGVLNRAERWLRARGNALADATTDDLAEFLHERLQTVSPNTVIVDRRQLRAFYAWACNGDDPYLERPNPTKRLGAVKGEEPDPARTPSVEEWQYRALLVTCRRRNKPAGRGVKHCNDRRDAAIISLLWDSGMRRAELARIEYRHVDWDQATIHLARTKGRTATRSRTIPIGEEAFEAITRYLRERGEHEGYLFESTGYLPGTQRRRGLAPNSIYLMLQRRAELANQTQQLPGIVHAPSHAFRRASTMNDIDDGMSARTIQILKGWKQDGRQFGRYSKEREASQAIDEARAKRGRRHLRAVGDD